jgi:hypothetical protein
LDDGVASSGPVTAEKLAAQLRGHMLNGGVYYIEEEPNLEMARRILSGEVPEPTPEGQPLEGRRVVGSDGRVHTSLANNADPNSWIGFSEIGCTANMIGYKTATTAAHCVYETQDPVFTEGWYCDNGNVVGTAACANHPYPRWRFGVEDGNGFSAWISFPCVTITVQTAYISSINNTNFTTGGQSAYDMVRWDYAVLDLSQCPTAGMGHYGTAIFNDTQIADATGQAFGYPQRATCPDNAAGTIDCPGTGASPGSTYRYNSDTSKPYSGAEIWGMSSTDIVKGAFDPNQVIESSLDTTPGQSGSAMYVFAPDRRIIGHSLTGSIGNVNVWHRFDTETYNWVDANSPFPSDL